MIGADIGELRLAVSMSIRAGEGETPSSLASVLRQRTKGGVIKRPSAMVNEKNILAMSGKKHTIPISESDRLREFVKLVDEQNSSRFNLEFLTTNLTIRTSGGSWRNGEILDFDEDYCRSFILNFRLLIQDNDGISIKTVCQTICDGDYDEDIKGWLSFKRKLFNSELDQKSPYSDKLSHRQLIDVFMWGLYAHRGMNPITRKIFVEWESDKETFILKKQSFLLALKIVHQFSVEISSKVRTLLNDA